MKIIIVGGGTAGWMAAATLKKRYPDYDIEVIESDSIPPIGVGESTTQFFSPWLHYLGLKPEDWMPHCNATYKLSVRFKDFHEVGDTRWQYPFGQPKIDSHGMDVWFREAMINNWDNSRLARDHWVSAEMAQRNVIGDYDNFKLGKDTGYHYNATEFSIWLRDNYCIPRGVIHTIGHVDKVDFDEDGVKQLIMRDQKDPVTADLFIDCTGFKSLLNPTEYKPYDYLPNNRAWATRLDYKDKSKQMTNCTDCTALSSGWVWNVPTWDHIGTGYVFSNQYQSEEDALDEFKNHLGDNASEDQEYRLIKFTGGRRSEGWWKNVVSIGLSGVFLEPMESTGILSIHESLFYLIRSLDNRKVLTQQMRDIYNCICNKKWDGLASFIAMHYSYTQRNDSPYWKAVTQRSIEGEYHDLAMKIFNISAFSLNSGLTFQGGALIFILVIWGGHGFNPWNPIMENEVEAVDFKINSTVNHTYKNWDLLHCINTYDYYKHSLYKT